jgi:Glutamyl-tRNAGlu reductase, dimerisation domain
MSYTGTDKTPSFVLLEALSVARLPFPARPVLPLQLGTQNPGLASMRERLVVAIRLLPLDGNGVEVVTSAEVDSSPVLDSDISETIVSLREHFEAVRRGEVHRVRGRLGNLSSDQEDVVESLSRGLIEKVLQAPVAVLLNAAAANQSAFIVETVRRIFNLRT